MIIMPEVLKQPGGAVALVSTGLADRLVAAIGWDYLKVEGAFDVALAVMQIAVLDYIHYHTKSNKYNICHKWFCRR